MVWPILVAFGIGFALGTIGTILILGQRTQISVRPLVKGILITVAIALITIAELLIIFPDVITDPPTEIWCEPPLENYNSVCSCGPEKELTKGPGGEMICAPMNT